MATTRVDATTSYCAQCREHVTDLSAMTEADARTWLSRHAIARGCVSYRVRPDATIVFAPQRAAIHLGAWLALLLACAPLQAGSASERWWCHDEPGEELACPQPAPPSAHAFAASLVQGFIEEVVVLEDPAQVDVPGRRDGARAQRRALRRTALAGGLLPEP